MLFGRRKELQLSSCSKVQNTLLHSISSLPPVLASLASPLRGEGTAIHTRHSLVPAPSSSCKNPRRPFPGWSCSSAQNLEPIYLSSNSCRAAGFLYNLKILILSVFSFQQYVTAIIYQPHKLVARLNPFVSHLATNLRNADCCCCCYDYDYYYCHFGTALSQPWMFCYDICTYPNLQPTLKYQFPQKIFLFFGHSILDLHPQRPLRGWA